MSARTRAWVLGQVRVIGAGRAALVVRRLVVRTLEAQGPEDHALVGAIVVM
jgi:hypothetical protein